jgi:thiol:disulfide interchange protein DsbA
MRSLILVLGFVLSLVACAEEPPAAAAPGGDDLYKEGQHYIKMLAPVPSIVGADKVEVTEIFRFGCPACFQFSKNVETWEASKPAFVEFVPNPVVWNEQTKKRAQVYYAAKKLGVADQTAKAIFESLHVTAKSRADVANAFMKEAQILDHFVAVGVEREKAKKMLDSFSVRSLVNQADGRARAFAVSGTPEIFVDGRYRITTSSAGSFENMLKVATFVAGKVAAERGISK